MFEPILDLHFDKQKGTPYWLDLLEKKGLKRSDFHTSADFFKLGAMDVEQLRTRPIEDFIPASLLGRQSEMILSETGGTTGDPCRRVYLPEEFKTAFVDPWLKTAIRFNFPKGGRWLFIGPSGPHIIAQAARAFARGSESLEPFSIDCDVRWIKQQHAGSMGHLLYMDHLFIQALNIIKQQRISVLFTTPPLLLGLAERMSSTQREEIRGIHTGGMAQDNKTSLKLKELFPAAVIIPGYGNSLFGVAFEKEQKPGVSSTFFVCDPALHLKLIPLPQKETERARLTETVEIGQRGRVLFHRFDKSFLIINLLERDTAIREEFEGEPCLSHVEGLSYQKSSSTGVY